MAQLKDSLLLEEVVVEVKKTQPFVVGSRVTAIDSAFLGVNNSMNLGEALELRTPLYLKTYGNAMSSTVSFRGTSASQTAVLWNGFNINNAGLGLTDFSIIPLQSFTNVSVLHGSSGANFGSGSIGGTILLSSEPVWERKAVLRVQQDGGSFSHYFSTLSFRAGTEKLQSTTGFYNNTALNNFRYNAADASDSNIQRQVNAQVRQHGLLQDLDVKLNSRAVASFKAWYNYSDRRIPPGIGVANTHDRQYDENLRLTAALNYQSSIGKTILRTAYFNDQIRFVNDNIVQSNSLIHTLQGQLEHEAPLWKDKLGMRAGLEWQHYNALIQNSVRTQNRESGFLLFNFNPVKRILFNLNIRKPFIQGYNPPLTPALGVNVHVRSTEASVTQIKLNVSRGYRVPSLNDRFWVPGGNPDLKPETSKNMEAGIQHKIFFKNATWESEISLFRMLVDNWIYWYPSGSVWTPGNILKVRSQGLEVSTKFSYELHSLKFSLGGMYAYTSSQSIATSDPSFIETGKQLFYVPYHKFIAYTEANCKGWIMQSNFSFTGYRYTLMDDSDYLPGYGLLNLSAGKSLDFNKNSVTVLFKINNLLNTSYQTMANRPMPLRNYTISLRLNLTKPLK